MKDEWISVRDSRKPEINTWVEVIHDLFDNPLEYFYDKDGFCSSKGVPWIHVTHWRHCTHSLLNGLPAYSVQLPITSVSKN